MIIVTIFATVIIVVGREHYISSHALQIDPFFFTHLKKKKKTQLTQRETKSCRKHTHILFLFQNSYDVSFCTKTIALVKRKTSTAKLCFFPPSGPFTTDSIQISFSLSIFT
mmetsp:Transcript_21517/g.32029  ORF Transcript_21517/g.32029 Transcript_21517/m.32029 type:complete len:111 (+) Transcript_21517:24-356(+)